MTPSPFGPPEPVVLRHGVPNTRMGRLWRRLTRCWRIGHDPEIARPKSYGPGYAPRECQRCGISLEGDALDVYADTRSIRILGWLLRFTPLERVMLWLEKPHI